MSRNLSWRSDGRVFVNVHTAQDPSNLEWSELVAAARELSERGEVRVYVVSYGGSPSGAQRSELATALQKKPAPTVLLTGNRIVRALTSVLAWFNPRMMAVGLWDHQAACDFLGLTATESARATVLRKQLEKDLGLDSETTQLVASAP